MQCTFEWKAQHAVDITPGSYFASEVITRNGPLEASRGHDEFDLHAMILPEKRIAGFGRKRSYRLNDLPAGLSALEAAPSQPLDLPDETDGTVSFLLNTNLFLGQDLLSHHLSLGVYKQGQYREIPLQSPSVGIDWQARGQYIISVRDL